MTNASTIAPVRKSVSVETSQQRAFEVFTAGLGEWWPTGGSIGASPIKRAAMETRLGGRWYEIGEDGSETTVGKILLWDPPSRFVVSWEISAQWKPDPGNGSEVEVVFTPEGPHKTRVDLEHRKFERMGQAAGASIRKDVDGGWPKILERFAAEARGKGV